MKKFLVFVSLIGATQLVHAVKPEQPWLLTPISATPLPLATPVSFSWANTKSLPKYRLVVSTNPDFSGYNQKTNKCSKSCFTTTVPKLTTYSLSDTNPFLKPDSNYYWRVEAINAAGESSLSDVRAFAYGTPTLPLDPKFVLAVMPVLTAVPPSPASVEQGKTVTFAATLDVALPTGYSVKVNYGNGLVLMTGSGTSFSYAATPSAKSSLYTIGIYDSKNVLKSNKVTGNFEVTPIVPPNVPPTLKLVSGGLTTANVDAIYSVTLSATDANGNLRLITVNWGDNTSDTLNAADAEKITFSHSYNPANSYNLTATAYDYSDAASLVPVTKTVVVSVPVPPAISTTGTTITPTSTTGCNTDKAGLKWEVKTNDSRLHDKDWTYSWYEPDASKNGGYAGSEHGGKCNGTSKCNTYDYINAVNTEGLCGATDWRLPTKSELEGLVFCSDKKSATLGANEQGDICIGTPSSPTIDTVKFPNTKSDWFWTSSTIDQPVVIVPTPVTPATTTAATGAATPASITPVKKVTTPKKPVVKPAKPDGISAWTVLFYNKGNAAGVRLVSGGATKK